MDAPLLVASSISGRNCICGTCRCMYYVHCNIATQYWFCANPVWILMALHRRGMTSTWLPRQSSGQGSQCMWCPARALLSWRRGWGGACSGRPPSTS